MASPMARTVLIVDDHAGFRASARAMLESQGFEVVGEAADGEQALDEVARTQPEVVLLDVQLPGADGFAVAEQLARDPAPPVIVLVSSRNSVARDPRLAETPARGFISKDSLSGAALAGLVE
jgi:DNA-binding NarL/FixJ family response regulator